MRSNPHLELHLRMVDVKFNRDRPQTHCGGKRRFHRRRKKKAAPEAAVTESNPVLYADVFNVFLTLHTQNKLDFLFFFSGLCVSEGSALDLRKNINFSK